MSSRRSILARVAVIVALSTSLASPSPAVAATHVHGMTSYDYVGSGTVGLGPYSWIGLQPEGMGYPIMPGDTIAFANIDPRLQPHTVTSCIAPCGRFPEEDALYRSGFIVIGEVWTLDTTGFEPGTYFYYCDHHPSFMRGSFTILDA